MKVPTYINPQSLIIASLMGKIPLGCKMLQKKYLRGDDKSLESYLYLY